VPCPQGSCPGFAPRKKPKTTLTPPTRRDLDCYEPARTVARLVDGTTSAFTDSPARSTNLRARRWLETLLRGVVLLPALGFVALYLGCAALRCSYPWEIEWMEGGMITHAARVLRGLQIYAPPSSEFIAYFYTPVYAYVLAALSFMTDGLSFGLARGVSIAASLACLGMLFYCARRERGWLAGVLAIGFYAALFRTCGAFYDLARVDSLSLAFVLAASLVAYYKRSHAGSALAAACVVLAFFTKQTSAIVGAFIGLSLLQRNFRHALSFGATGAALGALIGLWLEHSSGGWFSFYTLSGHQGHAFHVRRFVLEYWTDLLFLCPFVALVPTFGASYGPRARWFALLALPLWCIAFGDRIAHLSQGYNAFYRELWYGEPRGRLLVPPLLTCGLLLLARLARPARAMRAPAGYFLSLFCGAALASALNYSTQWAHSNCFMPVALFASLYSGQVLAPLFESARVRGRREHVAMFASALVIVLQWGALAYDPRTQVPSAGDRAAVREFQATLARFPGPVFASAHPLYSYLRDGTIHAHAMGFNDVAYAGDFKLWGDRFKTGELPTVVVDSGGRRPPDLKTHYKKVYTFQLQDSVLMPRSGFQVRPRFIYVYRGRAASP
jgi:hypothetical protein